MRRILLFVLICALFSACKKEDTSIPDTSTFFGRFNGYAASISSQNPEYGIASYTALNVPTSPLTSNGSYASSLSSKDFTITITKSTLLFAGIGIPSAGEFQAFFAVGSVPYIDSAVFNGITVGYFDKNGVAWNSALGNQTGSVFTITKSEPLGGNVKIQAQFNCKLYDASGNTLQLTGGMFTGQFMAL